MRLLVSLSLALLALGVQPSCGLSFQHLIRTRGRLTQQDETHIRDPKLPVNAEELAFYNDPSAGDIIKDALVETDTTVRDTSYKVGDQIVAKQIDRKKNEEIQYGFTLGACLQRQKTLFKDGKNPLGQVAYRQDSALTTIHDFFQAPMNAIFRVAGPDDANKPNPYAKVVARKWFPEGDYTRIEFKPHAECTCFGAKSAKTKWPTMKDFITHMDQLHMSHDIDNAYFIGAVSKEKNKKNNKPEKTEFYFGGATKKLELNPDDNNHPRGSVTSYQEPSGHRASYDLSPHPQQNQKKQEIKESIEMFDVHVHSEHGDSGAGLYIKQLDKKGHPLQGNPPDLLVGILSGATDSDEYTKFTPIWNIDIPNNYHVC